MNNILSVKNVTKDYTGHKRALDDVSFDVPAGSVYGLLGPNGAGKTTLLRIINHITSPDSGAVHFDGHPLTEKDILSIGYLPEERGLYKKMRVGEQAMYFARLRGMSKADANRSLREWFDRFGMADWWGKKVEELSKGMAQKVQFIVTVIHRPRLLIFDEPFSGFDPINANLLKQEIMKLRDEGSTVIFSTHNMASVEEVCDNITLINRGRNVLSGNVEAIRRDFFGDRYDIVASAASADAARQALAPMAADIASEELPGGDVRLTMKLAEGVSLQKLVRQANEAAELRSFGPTLATMNEIFIRTVRDTASPDADATADKAERP